MHNNLKLSILGVTWHNLPFTNNHSSFQFNKVIPRTNHEDLVNRFDEKRYEYLFQRDKIFILGNTELNIKLFNFSF